MTLRRMLIVLAAAGLLAAVLSTPESAHELV
jgi:hypothetical protein